MIPVINSDGNVWKISVTKDEVSQEHLEQPQEYYHANSGSEKKIRYFNYEVRKLTFYIYFSRTPIIFRLGGGGGGHGKVR